MLIGVPEGGCGLELPAAMGLCDGDPVAVDSDLSLSFPVKAI